MKRSWPVFLLLLAACDTLPRDTEDTLARVQASGVVRIGVIAGPLPPEQSIERLGYAVAAEAKVRAVSSQGSAESLLGALDEGTLDLVVGAWGKKTPWRDKVTLTPKVWGYSVDGKPLEIRGAVRNGENKWAMLVEHAARKTAEQAGKE